MFENWQGLRGVFFSTIRFGEILKHPFAGVFRRSLAELTAKANPSNPLGLNRNFMDTTPKYDFVDEIKACPCLDDIPSVCTQGSDSVNLRVYPTKTDSASEAPQ